jgi:hypothetical protein
MTQEAFTQNPKKNISDINASTHSKKRISKKSRRWAVGNPWFSDPYNPVLGECSLWMAVITQALMDSLSHSSHPEQRYHKEAAMQWLTGNSKDFIYVCTLAGMDPSNVRKRAKKALLTPVEWRASAGKGARYEKRKVYRERIKKSVAPAEDERRHTNPAQVISGPWQ